MEGAWGKLGTGRGACPGIMTRIVLTPKYTFRCCVCTSTSSSRSFATAPIPADVSKARQPICICNLHFFAQVPPLLISIHWISWKLKLLSVQARLRVAPVAFSSFLSAPYLAASGVGVTLQAPAPW